jgi:hypothetical protein
MMTLKEENYSLFKEAFEKTSTRNPSGPATSGNRY